MIDILIAVGVLLLLTALALQMVWDFVETNTRRRVLELTENGCLETDPQVLVERQQAEADLASLKEYGPTVGVAIRWCLYVGVIAIAAGTLVKIIT